MGMRMTAAETLLFCLVLIPAQSSSSAQSNDLAAKSQRAKEFMAQGKFTEAILLYRELNQAVPGNPGLMLNLGMALHLTGDDRASIPQLEAVVKLDPKLVPAWLFLGAARLELGQARTGLEDLKMVLHLQPDHRDALEMLASALLSLDRPTEAANQYHKLAELDPESSAAWYGLGRSYESLAVRAFDELQQTAPESEYWLALVADARLHEQQLSGAFYLYRRALEKAPVSHHRIAVPPHSSASSGKDSSLSCWRPQRERILPSRIIGVRVPTMSWLSSPSLGSVNCRPLWSSTN